MNEEFYDTGGYSGAWSKTGELIISADQDKECIVMLERKQENWKGYIL
jgi:hypothetical protein